MTAPMIGIVGASGAVGGAALANLSSEGRYALRAGYRSRPLHHQIPSDVGQQQVNIDDAVSLVRFVKIAQLY